MFDVLHYAVIIISLPGRHYDSADGLMFYRQVCMGAHGKNSHCTGF